MHGGLAPAPARWVLGLRLLLLLLLLLLCPVFCLLNSVTDSLPPACVFVFCLLRHSLPPARVLCLVPFPGLPLAEARLRLHKIKLCVFWPPARLSCLVLYTPQAGRTLRAGGRAGPPPPPQYMLRRALASPRVGARITRVRFSTKSNYLSHFLSHLTLPLTYTHHSLNPHPPTHSRPH